MDAQWQNIWFNDQLVFSVFCITHLSLPPQNIFFIAAVYAYLENYHLQGEQAETCICIFF